MRFSRLVRFLRDNQLEIKISPPYPAGYKYNVGITLYDRFRNKTVKDELTYEIVEHAASAEPGDVLNEDNLMNEFFTVMLRELGK